MTDYDDVTTTIGEVVYATVFVDYTVTNYGEETATYTDVSTTLNVVGVTRTDIQTNTKTNTATISRTTTT